MLESHSFLGGLSWVGSFSYLIWRGKEGTDVQASLLPWLTRPPAPTNLSFNLSGAVLASCWGPNLDHGGSRLQGACPRPDSKGDDPHVWRPHKPGETHCHGAHVAQHILECCRGWAYPVRAWGIRGAYSSCCMLAPRPVARTTAFHRPSSFPPAEFRPHQHAQGGGLWTGSAGNRCLPCSPSRSSPSPGQPSLAASDAQPTSSGLTVLFPHLVFSLPSALRPPLSHPK